MRKRKAKGALFQCNVRVWCVMRDVRGWCLFLCFVVLVVDRNTHVGEFANNVTVTVTEKNPSALMAVGVVQFACKENNIADASFKQVRLILFWSVPSLVQSTSVFFGMDLQLQLYNVVCEKCTCKPSELPL